MNKTRKGNKIKRIHKTFLEEIINTANRKNAVSDADQAEMAIPSYLNKNPFIRAMFWRRYDVVYRLSGMKPEMTVCEFGCGIGAFLPTLAAAAKKVYAVDLYPQYARELTQKLDLNVTFAEDMSPIPDKSLDLIFAVEVMEHLDNPAAYTQLFVKKLKPNGRLIMSGPTESRLYKFGRFIIGYNKYHDYHEHNVYQLRHIINNNGFTLDKTIRFPTPLLPLFLICTFDINENKSIM
jgi:2-polyprenyl-3-methyl-5-hydroxy-6-metoxy-1,4-benzoquinol methylase